jgi:peptidoglycan-associated lipoprotein
MSGSTLRTACFALGTAVVLSVGLSGCAHVKREEMEGRLASLRSEMQDEIARGDQETSDALGNRIDDLDGSLNGRIDELRRDLAALEEEFGAKVEELETALRFNVPVYFGFDESDVPGESIPVLDRFAQVVNRYYPGSLITVEGFTDPAGSAEYNQILGQRRADAVMAVLVDRGGLDPARVRAVSYGESTPRQVAANATGPGSTGWENRRVALVIDHGGM